MFSSDPITKRTAQFGREMIDERGRLMMKRTRRKKDDDTKIEISEERLQDFLMPGLRHAHTLQQLKRLDEYSPPGEYLIQLHLRKAKHSNLKNY